jgi:hypothetical protein
MYYVTENTKGGKSEVFLHLLSQDYKGDKIHNQEAGAISSSSLEDSSKFEGSCGILVSSE